MSDQSKATDSASDESQCDWKPDCKAYDLHFLKIYFVIIFCHVNARKLGGHTEARWFEVVVSLDD